MSGTKSLMGGLLNELTKMAGGSGGVAGLGSIADQAMKAWNGQSTATKGALGGALIGALLSRGGRQLLTTGAEVGGAALIGALAMKAVEGWRSGATAGATAPGGPVPDPGGTAYLPADPAAADDLAQRLLQAMVAAVKADGQVTDAERQAVNDQVATLKMAGDAASAVIAQELAAPLDAGRIAALARSPEEAAAIYTASALVVNREGAAEKGYLAMLAARLGLEPGLVAHLDATAAGAA